MSGAVTEPFIRVRNLRKVYRKEGREFPAISDATFAVAPGELACLVGPSGCGKTTLLKILAGLQNYAAFIDEVATISVLQLDADVISVISIGKEHGSLKVARSAGPPQAFAVEINGGIGGRNLEAKSGPVCHRV